MRVKLTRVVRIIQNQQRDRRSPNREVAAMTRRPNPSAELPTSERSRRSVSEPELFGPARVEVVLRAVVEGPVGLVKYEVEVYDGESRDCVGVICGWRKIDEGFHDFLSEFVDALTSARGRVSPF